MNFDGNRINKDEVQIVVIKNHDQKYKYKH